MEKENKLGQEPAFAKSANFAASTSNHDYDNKSSDGMSKRLYIATQLMAGLLSNPNITNFDNALKNAYSLTDELLKQELESIALVELKDKLYSAQKRCSEENENRMQHERIFLLRDINAALDVVNAIEQNNK